jgi:hypothetical protein
MNPARFSFRVRRMATSKPWLRVLMAALLVAQAGYVQFHVLAEAHDDASHFVAVSSHHSTGDEGASQHQPHSSSDHQIQTYSKHSTPSAGMAFLPSIALRLPDETQVACSHASRGFRQVPDQPPPSSLSSRAPPLI